MKKTIAKKNNVIQIAVLICILMISTIFLNGCNKEVENESGKEKYSSEEIEQDETMEIENGEELKRLEEEEKKAEEEAKRLEEEEKKAEEEVKRLEEEAKKAELVEYYTWKAEQIVVHNFQQCVSDIILIEKDADWKIVVYAQGGDCDEKYIFTVDKNTETGTVVEHSIAGDSASTWTALNRNNGLSFDFSSEEGLVSYQEWLTQNKEKVEIMDSAIQQTIQHINSNWSVAVGGEVTAQEDFMSIWERDYGGDVSLHYMNADKTECYTFHVLVFLDDGAIAFNNCYRYDGEGERTEEVSIDFQDYIDM